MKTTIYLAQQHGESHNYSVTKHFYSSIIIIAVKLASTHVCTTKYFAFSTIFMIFGSDDQIELLRTASVVYVDATFRVVPWLFHQRALPVGHS